MTQKNELVTQKIKANAPFFFSELCELAVWDTLDSTNSYLLRERSSHTRAIIALDQSHGRGRLGKTWYAKAGDQLCVSLGFFLNKMPEDLSALTLAIGIGLADFFESNYKLSNIKLKWPNDLYVNDAKLGGILIESQFAKNSVHIVIGFGLNIHLSTEIIEKTKQNITSLDQYININNNNNNNFFCELSANTIQKIYQIFKQFEANNFSEFMPKFKKYDYFLGQKITQNNIFMGKGFGINQMGAYQIMQDNGDMHWIQTGEMGLFIV